MVKNTHGGIGYADIAYAVDEPIPVMAVRNAAGKYTTPGMRGDHGGRDRRKIGANNEMHIDEPAEVGAVGLPDLHLSRT